MNNIILIGMSGAGKSTLGVLLAKALNKDFIDTDIVLQQNHGMLLPDIIKEVGTDQFKVFEDDMLKAIESKNSIIATGGSVIYCKEGMSKLKALGTVVYLEVSYEQIESRLLDIHSRGIVMDPGKSLEDVYKERVPLYKQYADLTVSVETQSIEETVELIIKKIDLFIGH